MSKVTFVTMVNSTNKPVRWVLRNAAGVDQISYSDSDQYDAAVNQLRARGVAHEFKTEKLEPNK